MGQPSAALPVGTRISTDIPQRLDRLPWSTWHWRVVIALGITWMLDGLEVTLVGSIASVLGEPDTLHLSDSQVGGSATAYLAGAIAGALLFGRLTDSYGRKRLFLVTLSLYVGATLLTAASWNFASFALFRALTGAGIGGEYSAVNSAVDELLPARVRGRADLAINSTYWLGTALGACMTLALLRAPWIPHHLAWRFVFLLGAILGAGVLFLRNSVPESPRWLLLHGRVDEAEQVMKGIEYAVENALERQSHRMTNAAPGERSATATAPAAEPWRLPPPVGKASVEAKGTVTFTSIAAVLLRQHLRRTVLGLVLMIAQAFAYNGIFFTYALVLSSFYGVPAANVGAYLIPFAAGNLVGPLVLGHYFDSVGRKTMIAVTYIAAGVLMVVTGYAMAQGWLTATTLTLLWCAVFFVASAAASSAYLTVSELFPVELRGMAIALFYAVGTTVGGLGAPALFGFLLQTGSRFKVFEGYVFGAALMIAAGIVAAVFGISAEGKSLEQIAEAPHL